MNFYDKLKFHILTKYFITLKKMNLFNKKMNNLNYRKLSQYANNREGFNGSK